LDNLLRRVHTDIGYEIQRSPTPAIRNNTLSPLIVHHHHRHHSSTLAFRPAFARKSRLNVLRQACTSSTSTSTTCTYHTRHHTRTLSPRNWSVILSFPQSNETRTRPAERRYLDWATLILTGHNTCQAEDEDCRSARLAGAEGEEETEDGLE